jgi:hypothetical protein
MVASPFLNPGDLTASGAAGFQTGPGAAKLDLQSKTRGDDVAMLAEHDAFRKCATLDNHVTIREVLPGSAIVQGGVRGAG